MKDVKERVKVLKNESYPTGNPKSSPAQVHSMPNTSMQFRCVDITRKSCTSTFVYTMSSHCLFLCIMVVVKSLEQLVLVL